MENIIVTHASGAYYLRGTVWTSDRERATVHTSESAAHAAIAAAKRFNPKGVKGATLQAA